MTKAEISDIIQALAAESGGLVVVIIPRPGGVDRQIASGVDSELDAIKAVAMLGTSAKLAADHYAKQRGTDPALIMLAAAVYHAGTETVEEVSRHFDPPGGGS